MAKVTIIIDDGPETQETMDLNVEFEPAVKPGEETDAQAMALRIVAFIKGAYQQTKLKEIDGVPVC